MPSVLPTVEADAHELTLILPPPATVAGVGVAAWLVDAPPEEDGVGAPVDPHAAANETAANPASNERKARAVMSLYS
jgi:hypothetical protein